MSRSLLGALHLIGAALFVVFMIARAAQAEGDHSACIPTVTATGLAGPNTLLGSRCSVGTRDGSETPVILSTGTFRPA